MKMWAFVKIENKLEIDELDLLKQTNDNEQNIYVYIKFTHLY